MAVGFVAFDIETDGLIADDGAPPAVVCAATMCMTEKEPGAYHVEPPVSWCAGVESPVLMTETDLKEMIDYLEHLWEHRRMRPLTWNGLGFDFRVLAAHFSDCPGYSAKVRRLARAQVDPCFNFFMRKGFPVALASVAKAFGTVNKSGHGADVARAWAEGTVDDRRGVLRYCEQDVVVLAVVVSCAVNKGRIKWMTKSQPSRLAEWRPFAPGDMVAPASAALLWPEPDNSWMDRPSALRKPGSTRPTRDGFGGWLSTE